MDALQDYTVRRESTEPAIDADGIPAGDPVDGEQGAVESVDERKFKQDAKLETGEVSVVKVVVG